MTDKGQLRFLLAALLIPLFLMMGQLQAHQRKEAVTKVIFNQRTNSIEIIHRFLIHDAEHAAGMLFGKSTDIIGDKGSQQQFSKYVMDNFTMEDLSDRQLPLETVGFEVDSRFIWVYQETPLVEPVNGLRITHNALREIWPQQVNLLNIERGKSVNSLIFKGSLEAQSVSF